METVENVVRVIRRHRIILRDARRLEDRRGALGRKVSRDWIVTERDRTTGEPCHFLYFRKKLYASYSVRHGWTFIDPNEFAEKFPRHRRATHDAVCERIAAIRYWLAHDRNA